VETVENIISVIVNALKEGKNVPIPNLGFLELKTLSGKKTVFFTQNTADNGSFASAISGFDADGLETLISKPLQDGESVTIPQIGVFRPIPKSDGSFRVSYIPSSGIRNLLNGVETPAGFSDSAEEERNTEPLFPLVPQTDLNKSDEVEVEKENEQPVVIEASADEATPVKPIGYSSSERKRKSITHSKVGDQIVTEDNSNDVKVVRRKKSNLVGWLLGVACAVLLCVIIYSLFHKSGNDEAAPAAQVNSTTNLPALAEKNYGNPAYWVYIYAANIDRLNSKSPVNIPSDVELVIPNLKNDFEVDVTDSLELSRAKNLEEIILNNLAK
jgi:nucleoid DNA-binding protein